MTIIIKKKLVEYILYILFCIKIYSYNKKKDYKRLILFITIFIIIKSILKLNNSLSLFISFIISKCLIDDNKKIENFGVIGDILSMVVNDIKSNPGKALETAKDMIENRIDNTIAAINANPVSQIFWKANNFVKTTVGINPSMFIPGMAQLGLVKALYEVVKSDNPCEFCKNSMNVIFVKGLGKAKKKLNAGKYCKKAGQSLRTVVNKSVDKIMRSKYIQKMKKRLAKSSIEKKKPWIMLATPAIMKIYKELLIVSLTKSCAQYASKGVVKAISVAKAGAEAGADRVVKAVSVAKAAAVVERFKQLSKADLIDISQIWLDMVRPVCEEFKIDGGEIFGTLGPMCKKNTCDDNCQQQDRNRIDQNKREYADKNTNQNFSEDIELSSIDDNKNISAYSLIKSNNLVYSITQNINAAKNKTFENLTTTSNKDGQGAILTITTDTNGYCNSVEIIDTGIDYGIGDKLIVSKNNIEGSNRDLIFTLKDINLTYTEKVELGLTYTCNGNVSRINYGKCLDSQSNIIDNINKSNCNNPKTWLKAKMYNKTCKGWYKLACYNGDEIVENQDNCDTNWNNGRCLVNLEKNQSECNGYKESWNTTTSKCQKEKSNRETCEAKGYKFKHGSKTKECMEIVKRVLNTSEDGYCLCGEEDYNTNSIFELRGTDYVKDFRCIDKCRLAYQCESCSFEMAKYIADKLNKSISKINAPIKGLFKLNKFNTLFYSDPEEKYCNEISIKNSINNAPNGTALGALKGLNGSAPADANVKKVCRVLKNQWFFANKITSSDISRPSLADVSAKEISDFNSFANNQCRCKNKKNPDTCNHYTSCKEKNIIESVRNREIKCMKTKDPYKDIRTFNTENGTNLVELANPTNCIKCDNTTCNTNIHINNRLININSVRPNYYANCDDMSKREGLCKESNNPFDNANTDNYYTKIEEKQLEYKNTCDAWNGGSEIWEDSKCIRKNITNKLLCRKPNEQWNDFINKCVVSGKNEYFCRREDNHEWWHGRCFWNKGPDYTSQRSKENCRLNNYYWKNSMCYNFKQGVTLLNFREIKKLRDDINKDANKYKSCQDKKRKEDNCKSETNVYTGNKYKSCQDKKDTEDYCKFEGWESCQHRSENIWKKCKGFEETNEGCEDNTTKFTGCNTGPVGSGYCLCNGIFDTTKTRKVKKFTCEKSSINCNNICKESFLKENGGSLIRNQNLVDNINPNIIAEPNQTLYIEPIAHGKEARIKVKTNELGDISDLIVSSVGTGYKAGDVLKIFLKAKKTYHHDKKNLILKLTADDINDGGLKDDKELFDRITQNIEAKPETRIIYAKPKRGNEKISGNFHVTTDNTGQVNSIIVASPGKGYQPGYDVEIKSTSKNGIKDFFKYKRPIPGDVLKVKLTQDNIENDGSLIKGQSLFDGIIKNIKYKRSYTSTFGTKLLISPGLESKGAKFIIKTNNEGEVDSVIVYKVGSKYLPGEELIIYKDKIPGANKNLIITLNSDNIVPTLGYNTDCNMEDGKCNEWIPAGQGKTCICKYNRDVDVNKDKNKFGTTCARECKKTPEHTIKRDPVYRGLYWDTKEKKTTPGCIGWTETETCDKNSKKIEKYGCMKSINKSSSKGFCTCLDGYIKKYYCPNTNNTNCQEVCEKKKHINPSKNLDLPYSIFEKGNFEVIIHIKKSIISNDEDDLNKIIKLKFRQNDQIKKIKFLGNDKSDSPYGLEPKDNYINVKVINTDYTPKIAKDEDLSLNETIELNNRINVIEFYHKYESKQNISNKYRYGKINDLKIILSNVTDEKTKKIYYYPIN